MPVLLIAGDISSNKTHLQSLPQRELVLATGAGFEQARTSATTCRDLYNAFRRAFTERRPIVFNVSTEFLWEEVEYSKTVVPLRSRHDTIEYDQNFEEAISIIANAKRPVILAGRGASQPTDRTAIADFTGRVGAPLMTTLMAKDLFREEAHSMGVMGTISTPEAVDALQKADCIIGFGASLTSNTTSEGTLVKGKRLVLFNDDPSDLDNHQMINAGVIGSPASAAERFVHWLDEAEIPPSGFTDEGVVKAAVAAYKSLSFPTASETYDAQTILRHVNAALPPDRLFITNSGRCLGEAWRIVDVTDPRLFVLGHNSGAIGLGVSHAIGAAVAEPQRPALMVTGDGGFMMGGLTEFNTAVSHKLDLIVLMFNDRSYGFEHIQFRDRQMDPSLSCFDWPEFAPIADALGGKGVTVRSMADMQAMKEALSSRNRPLLIDVQMDPDNMPPPPW
jgi:thiamine pyrophosphate-dependent acetolactate synthase large subunit-like protein